MSDMIKTSVDDESRQLWVPNLILPVLAAEVFAAGRGSREALEQVEVSDCMSHLSIPLIERDRAGLGAEVAALVRDACRRVAARVRAGDEPDMADEPDRWLEILGEVEALMDRYLNGDAAA